MAATTRTTSARKSSAAAAPAQMPAEAPVSPAGGFDLASLAAAAQTAPDLPSTGTGGSSPFVPLLERSRDESIAFTLPPVADEKAARSVVLAVRRAARLLDCGVRVRSTTDAGGAVTVAFQYKVKRTAK